MIGIGPSAHRVSAIGHRVRKGHPEGGASGHGTSPGSGARALRSAGVVAGIAASRALVYGCEVRAKS